jgi:DNA processing protein
VSEDTEAERLARAVLTAVAEPGDPVMGALLHICGPAAIVAALAGGLPVPGPGAPGDALSRWDAPAADPPPAHDGEGGGNAAGVAAVPPAGADEPGPGPGAGRPPSGPGAGQPFPGPGRPPSGPGPGRPLPGAGRPPSGPGRSLSAARAVTGVPSRVLMAKAARTIPGLDSSLARWSARLPFAPSRAMVEAWQREGIRLVIPADPEWPGQLDVLGTARPWGLWVRGNGDLRYACLRSVAMVGARAATAYGAHVSTDLATALAERGWTVISGGAYGIDGCAHRGALAAHGVTVAVLACGVDYAYPQGHHELFRSIREDGAIVSEWPPGRTPTKPGFLVRNRVIAALSRGTVVVEAALRSGALNTARHAHDQGRPLMAVPGPVTSPMSAGCHEIIREWGAVCVTSAGDIAELLSFPGEGHATALGGPVLPKDVLDAQTARVLEAVPARAGRGPARIAAAAGVDFGTVMACLGALAAGGFVERCDRGWRLRGQPRELP